MTRPWRGAATALWLVFNATNASAAPIVQPCDGMARADAIVEPWTENTKTYSREAVRLAMLNLVAPAVGPFHILILSPPLNEQGQRQCRTVGLTKQVGFAEIDFQDITVDYNAANGLTFKTRVKFFNGTEFLPARLRFTLNQQSGAIKATLY